MQLPAIEKAHMHTHGPHPGTVLIGGGGARAAEFDPGQRSNVRQAPGNLQFLETCRPTYNDRYDEVLA